jgi:hypothetical protein
MFVLPTALSLNFLKARLQARVPGGLLQFLLHFRRISAGNALFNLVMDGHHFFLVLLNVVNQRLDLTRFVAHRRAINSAERPRNQ